MEDQNSDNEKRVRSIKEIQSELGVTGEVSPNLELCEKAYYGYDNFEHDHSNITKDDSLLLLSHVYCGEKKVKQKGEKMMAYQCMIVGCEHNIYDLLVAFFHDYPDLIIAAKLAIQKAEAEQWSTTMRKARDFVEGLNEEEEDDNFEEQGGGEYDEF